MKIEIDDDKLVSEIVDRVIERLKPLLNSSSNSKNIELMTVEDVAIYLKAKKSSIYDKVHSKVIPFLKYGNSLRFKKKHIDIWLRNPYHPDLDNYNLNHNGRG